MADTDEIIRKFKRFAARSKEAYSEMYDRIRKDRAFMSGENQWSSEDDSFVEKTRNRIVVNVLSNQAHSVANRYSNYSYIWSTGDPKIDKEIDDFFAEDSNRFATEEALLDSVCFGLGVMALGTDTTADGRDVPVLYAIDDLERVMLDPDASELDYSDAVETALIDYRSKEWIRIHMGEQYVPEKRAKPVFTGAFCQKDLVPIITYYYLDTDGCHVATLVNDILVEEETPTVLPIKRIPVFCVFGEKTWVDDKKIYQGLVAKGKTVQKVVNYCMLQLLDRLALSPKPQWRGYMESFKNYDSYYKRAGRGINPIIPAQRLANDKTSILPLPEPFQPRIEFADLQGIIDGTMNMMTSITGVDTKGLADSEGEITATAVMYTSQVFANNVKHFFSHLKTAFKSCGDVCMTLMGHAGVKISVVQGPEDQMQNQVARAELSALMGVVEPNQKRAIVNAILKTHPDNEILAELYADLNSIPQPTEMEMQAQQLIEQMKKAIDDKDQEILSLTQQLEEIQRSDQQQDKDQFFQLKKMELEHQYAVEDEILKAQLNQGLDADRAAIEAQREEIKLEADAERAAIEAESGKMKLRNQAIKDRMDIEHRQATNEINLMNKLFGGNGNEDSSAQ
jgi:hypothetical protein